MEANYTNVKKIAVDVTKERLECKHHGKRKRRKSQKSRNCEDGAGKGRRVFESCMNKCYLPFDPHGLHLNLSNKMFIFTLDGCEMVI